MSQKKGEKWRFPGRRDSKNKVSGHVTSSVLEYRVQGRMVRKSKVERARIRPEGQSLGALVTLRGPPLF